MVLIERDDGIRLIKIESIAQARPFRPSFAGAYQTVFAEPPYNERFYPSEAGAVLTQILESPDHMAIFAVRGETQVVGFGLGVPVASYTVIQRQLRGLLPVKHSYYFAELGGLEPYRRKGIGRSLTQTRVQLVDPNRFSHIVLRTSVARDASYTLYQELGFEDMGVYTEISSRRTDGSVRTDRRMFLSRLIEPTRLSG